MDVDVAAPDGTAFTAAASSGIPLEVALLVDDEANGAEAIAPLLVGVPIARVLIHLRSGATIPGSLARHVRTRLGAGLDGVPIVGGTSSFFSELNRLPPDGEHLDAVGFGISATVHASDERSMMETLEIQRDVARRAGELAGGVPIVVSPIVLDTHVGTPFADAWTIGSVASLAAAGVASMTYAVAAPALVHAISLRDQELRGSTVFASRACRGARRGDQRRDSEPDARRAAHPCRRRGVRAAHAVRGSGAVDRVNFEALQEEAASS